MNKRNPAGFTEADENLAGMLDSLSGASNYLEFIVELMSPHLSGPILEIGAGLGDLTGRLATQHPVTATDVSDRCLDHLNTQFNNDDSVTVKRYDAIAGGPVDGQPADGFGSAVMSNVLEHFADDVAVLSQLRQVIRPGGTVVVFVPAFEALYGDFDQKIGHHRRYTKGRLEKSFEASGLTPTQLRYVNLPGWFAWLLTVRLMGMTPTGDGLVGVYERFVIPLVRTLDTRLAPLFGQSVLGVATVPNT